MITVICGGASWTLVKKKFQKNIGETIGFIKSGEEKREGSLEAVFLPPPSPSLSFCPPTNDPFTRFLSIRTPLRGECWITLRKSVLDFLSRVTKQTLNRENSSCFSLFFGFCYSYTFILCYTFPFSFSKEEGGRREGRVCTSVESFRIFGSFNSSLVLTSYSESGDVRNEFFFRLPVT